MIINQTGATFEYEGVTYTVGGSVIGTAESEYKGLYGFITEIRDGEDKDTDNDTPDLYCEFDPPVLPHEVTALEEVFSDLYQQPKSIDDIILDLVIMAPTMVQPLDDLDEDRYHPTIYLVEEDWAVNGQRCCSSDVFTDLRDAIRHLNFKLKEEKREGCLVLWRDNEKFTERSSSPFSYRGYIEGEYDEKHYQLSIIEQQLCASDQFFHKMVELSEEGKKQER